MKGHKLLISETNIIRNLWSLKHDTNILFSISRIHRYA